MGDTERQATRTKRTERPDGLVALVTAVRWGTTTVGLLWAAALRAQGSTLILGILLLAYALWRTFRPVEYRRSGWRSLLSILSELTITLAVVVSTSCWDSPYIFALFTPVIAAGFARGFWHAFRIALTGAITVGLAAFFLDKPTGIRPITAWSGELLLTAAVAAYGRHLVAQAEKAGEFNLTQRWRLNEANALLVNLNRLSQDLPASFDFRETVNAAIDRVRDASKPDVIVLAIRDPLGPSWRMAIAEGVQLSEIYDEDQLPAIVQHVIHGTSPQIIRDLSPEQPGFGPRSRAGLYVPMWAGPRRVGLLVTEAEDRDRFQSTNLEQMRDLAESAALAIDNARWFERLRARGAAQERNRIARDLHDRVGQGIAYVAFELDRLSSRAKGTELEDDLDHLRTDARSMVRELRETLYDLRTDVSGEHTMVDTITDFLRRVEGRSAIRTSFEHDASFRLSLSQEREIWRIAQEAVVNAERHAEAQHIDVRWVLDEQLGVLTVEDDGIGMHHGPLTGTSGAPDLIASIHPRPGIADENKTGYGESASPGRPSYGLTGMRERADALGARLEVTSDGPTGTTVRLTIESRRQPMFGETTGTGER